MISNFPKWIKKFRRSFHALWAFEGTPAERARGIAVGVFSGCFPFFGIQSFFGVCFASLFKGNHLLAVIGTWISNPLTYVPLYWFNYKIGSFFLGRDIQFNNFSRLTQQQMWEQGWIITSSILLGSLIVGFFAGLILGLSSYIFFKSLSKKKNF